MFVSKLGNLATKFGLRIANAYSKSGGELSYKWFVERFELNVISRYSYEDSCWMMSHLIEYAIYGEPIWKLVDELISLAERYKLNIWDKNSLFLMAIDVVENLRPQWHMPVPKSLCGLLQIKPHYNGDIMRTLSNCKSFVDASLDRHKHSDNSDSQVRALKAMNTIKSVNTLIEMEAVVLGSAHRLLVIADRILNAERGPM